MLAMPSLRKRPIKAPNLKSLRPFSPFTWARERISIKIHGLESRIVTGPSDTLFAGMYMCALQQGNFTGWNSEGVDKNEEEKGLSKLWNDVVGAVKGFIRMKKKKGWVNCKMMWLERIILESEAAKQKQKTTWVNPVLKAGINVLK